MPNEAPGASAPASSPAASAPSSSPASTPSQAANPFARHAASERAVAPVSQPQVSAVQQTSTEQPAQFQDAQPGQTQPPIQAQPPQQIPQQVVMTPEMLAQVLRQNQPQQQVQQPVQQAPQMTDQEFRQRYNVFEASAEDYTRLFGVSPDSQERVDALNTVLQNISRQSVTMAKALFENQMAEFAQQFESRLGPIQQTFSEQREAQLKQQFFQKYPQFNGREALLREIVTAAQHRGMKFPSPAEAMDYVARTASAILGSTAQTSQQAVQTAATRMPPVSMGGRSGGSQPQPAAKNVAQRIFGRSR